MCLFNLLFLVPHPTRPIRSEGRWQTQGIQNVFGNQGYKGRFGELGPLTKTYGVGEGSL